MRGAYENTRRVMYLGGATFQPVCERGGTMSNWTLYEGGGLVYDLSGVGGRWGS